MVKISKGNTKLGNVANISLVPIVSCPRGVPCSKDCYALKAFKQYKQTREAWQSNYKMAKEHRVEYFAQIAEYLDKHRVRFFRWHVAGDILDQRYYNSMVKLARAYPEVKFLVFTKRYNLDYARGAENLTVVISAWPGAEFNRQGLPVAWLQDGTETRVPSDAIECMGGCENCGMCWDLPGLDRDVVFNKH